MTLDFERERADANLVDGVAGTWEIGERHNAFENTSAVLRLDLSYGDGRYSFDGLARFLVDLRYGRQPRDLAPTYIGVRSVAIMGAATQSARTGCAIEVSSA